MISKEEAKKIEQANETVGVSALRKCYAPYILLKDIEKTFQEYIRRYTPESFEEYAKRLLAEENK